MPSYFFDFQYGDEFIDPSGFDRENEAAAIEKAARAIGILLDKPRGRSDAPHCRTRQYGQTGFHRARLFHTL
jgi:hypothetical protein